MEYLLKYFTYTIMKTNLILTDFSGNATNAATFGTYLSSKLHSNVLLFNTYLKFSEALSYAGGPWVVDDVARWKNQSKSQLKDLAHELEDLIAETETEDRMPSINYETEEGNLSNNVEDIINKKNIELVVMGARTGTTIDHVFYGSDTVSVIHQSKRPVFIIPAECHLKNITNVVFATDFEEADKKALQYLVELGQVFHFELEIIHVTHPGKKKSGKSEEEIAFLSQLSELKYPGITFKEIGGKDVVSRLNRLCSGKSSELLAMVHYQYSPLMRILHQSTTEKALTNQKIPLLVFPSGME